MSAALWEHRYALDSDSGCWLWLGATKGGKGYGRCKFKGRTINAHRAFYMHHVGPIPEGHELHHTCSTRLCVNPHHLVPMTRRDHVQKFSPHTKLTPEQAREIRIEVQALCEKYGIRPRTLAAIGEGTIWKEAENQTSLA